MKKIKLTQGKFALVDNEDFEWLNQWKWGYDGRYARRREKNIKIYMHTLINKTPKGKLTDHINRNKLDNRKSNLRSANFTLNINNSSLRYTNKSGHKGVWFWEKRNKWLSSITVNYKKIYLGIFEDKKAAIMVRKEAEGFFLLQGKQYE